MAQTENKGWIDGNLFINRNKFTYEQLAPYAGNHIAWSTDGTRIVAHGADFEELFAAVLQSGLSSEDGVFSYYPGKKVSHLC